MKLLVLTIAVIIALSGCANPYTQFYEGAQDARTDPQYVPSNEEIKILLSSDIQSDVNELLKKGYKIIGTSSFNGPSARVTEAQLLEQAKTIGAHVVVSSSKFTNSTLSSIPITTPQTTTSYTPFGTINSYGTQTTFVPFAIEKSDFNAVFLIKYKARIGLYLAPLDDSSRQKIESNYGVMVSTVIEGTPAFDIGIIPGDILTSVDGVSVRSVEHFRELTKNSNNGIEFTLYRNGRYLTKVVSIPRL